MKIKNKLKIFNEIDCPYKIRHISKELNNGLKNEEYFILQKKYGLEFRNVLYFNTINDVYDFIISYTNDINHNFFNLKQQFNASEFTPYLFIPGKEIIVNEISISYKDIDDLKSLKEII
jgi:glutaredoxin